jgi:hypothetical protein
MPPRPARLAAIDSTSSRFVHRKPPLAVVLTAVLLIWEPINLAFIASAGLNRLLDYGWPAVALLLYRAFVVGLGMAAGRALWTLHPSGPRLARVCVSLHALALVLTFLTPYFPSNQPPSTKTLRLGLTLTLDVMWWVWLSRSRRLRQAYST